MKPYLVLRIVVKVKLPENLNSTNSEMENVVEDSSVNEMEKSFTQEALEPIQSETVEEEDIQIPKFKGNKYPHEHVKEIGVRYSDYEVLFYEELCKHGIRTVPQYSVDQYKLDLALFDENNPDRKLNIELDGAEFHSDEKGELIIKDRIRNLKMIELGWDVQRFWNHQIRDNLEECINQVLYWKNNSLEE